MQIGEAKLSALLVSAVTGVGLTFMLSEAFRDLGFALTIAAPITLVMGAVLFLFASDKIKDAGEKPAPGKSTKGK